MFKPLIPIIKDKISHTFAEAIHIATVHAMYGSNHLQKEVSQASGETNNNHQSVNTEETVPVHLMAKELCLDINLIRFSRLYLTDRHYTITPVYISKVGPPPKEIHGYFRIN